MSSTTAIAELTAAFNEAFSEIGRDPARDRAIAVMSWPSAPIEIIRAAGLTPVIARGSSAATPMADAHLEAGIFPSRLRQLVDAVLTGRLSRVASVIVPRTSDPDYKCFLYLRELARRGIAPAAAPAYLFDMLQSRSDDVAAYDVARTRALIDALAQVAGRRPSGDDVAMEIARANAARGAARRLLALRRGAPRVTGTEAFPLLGAFWQMAPARYARLAGEAADQIATRPPLVGPRVLLAGAPADSPSLHEIIESHGAVVVGEVSPWGSGVAGDDVSAQGDPIASLADKYRLDAIGARTPVDTLKRWMERLLDVDALVVSLPPDDVVFGWDYPALRELLDARRIPHTHLRGDPYQSLSPADHARLDSLVSTATQRSEARHG